MDAEQLIESLIRSLMCLAGILGNNMLAIRSLPGKKSGIRTNELLFINLAVSNLITNYLVDLPDTIVDFAGRWFFGETFCRVFSFCANLSETSSILTTFFISIFWHQKLVGSLKRGGAPVQLDSLFLVGCLTAGSWTVAVAFNVPHYIYVGVVRGNESHLDCVDMFPEATAAQIYEIFYLTLANALPIAGIVCTCVQIVITLFQNQNRIRGHDSDATKAIAEDKHKGVDKTNDDRSVSTIAVGGNTKDSPIQVYTGVPPSSGPNGGLTGNNTPFKKETNTDSDDGPPPKPSKSSKMPAKPSHSAGAQVRAAKSVVAVASVFVVCWVTHLLLRITNNIHTSSMVKEVASYIAASYTCIIPYIFLYGVKKLSCSCKR
ncbi:hypothetical protein PBY51_023569 [Eleginops maclovinus]|uniref:G-protein coupled receptors family 1 profile domain-containing protein n=1 Tax=Eleginops maclovinus TaxID=56733 RepID=A0AAN7WYL4_ELEMC|nr:hypothetical protein PBY51_023569 [Eleginops maclovinus]